MKRIIQIFIILSALVLSACQSEMDKNSTMEENPVVTEAQTTLEAQITEKTMENVDMQITEELDTTKPEQDVLFVFYESDYKNGNLLWVIDNEGNVRYVKVNTISEILSEENWYDFLMNNLDEVVYSGSTIEELNVMYDFFNQNLSYGNLVKTVYDIKDYPESSVYLVHKLPSGDMELLKLASFGYYCECRSSKKARKFVKWLSEIGRFTLAGASFEDVYGAIEDR